MSYKHLLIKVYLNVIVLDAYIICNDGKNLIIGDEATVTYVLGESKKITTGAVFQYQLTGGNTWSKVKNILPDFLGASPPNEIDNAYADETSGVIDLNCKFGQYIDIRKITSWAIATCSGFSEVV